MQENVNTHGYPDTTGILLGFDLSSSSYTASVIVNRAAAGNHQLLLPFPVTSNKNDVELLSSVGNYDDFTLVNFTGGRSGGARAVYLSPIISDHQAAAVYNNEPSDGIYFIRDGLERVFVYNYEFINSNRGRFKIDSMQLDSLNFIAVKLPMQAQGKEILNGRTSIPDPLRSEHQIKLFPGTHSGKLKIKYELKTELSASKFYYLIVKSLLLILAPLIEILFSSILEDQKKKKRLTISVIIFQVLALVGMSILNFRGEFIGVDNVVDFITTAAIAILSSLLLYVKDKNKKV